MSPEFELPEHLAVQVREVTKVYALGELLSIKVTPGNVDDRKPVAFLCRGLTAIPD